MTTTREKTLSYRRAEWVSVSGLTLEGCLRDAHRKLKTIEDRTILREGRYIRSAKMQNAPGGGVFLHVTVETPGEAASLVPKVGHSISELELAAIKPPQSGEWLDGDAFLFVLDDHVCICTTGVHDGAVRSFLWELFAKANLKKEASQFALMKVADISKVKMIHKQGVKEIEIRATLFQASADYERRKAHVVGAAGAMAKHIKGYFKIPYDVTPDGIRVYLTMKTDARNKNHLALGEKRIGQMAEDLIKNFESGDEYVIITNDDQKITQNEIFMKTKAIIETDGKTVNRDQAWQELIKFFLDMKNSGLLEQ